MNDTLKRICAYVVNKYLIEDITRKFPGFEVKSGYGCKLIELGGGITAHNKSNARSSVFNL